MNNSQINRVNTLTFDIFGTVLNLAGSLVPHISEFLDRKGAPISGDEFWAQWRGRQRIEQYQDTITMLGHSGYLTVCKHAFMYILRNNGIQFTYDEVDEFMKVWQGLVPFRDGLEGLDRLKEKYKLVALSNGEPLYLEHLVKNQIKFPFDNIISVEEAGFFKPHPAVYRTTAKILGLEPGEIMMVAAHSFDIMGARACGYRGAYINRYGLPTEESPYQPDVTVSDFNELAAFLVDGVQPSTPDAVQQREE